MLEAICAELIATVMTLHSQEYFVQHKTCQNAAELTSSADQSSHMQ